MSKHDQLSTSQEKLQILYKEIKFSRVVGVEYHRPNRDQASAYGDYIEFAIDGILMRLHENGHLMQRMAHRYLEVTDLVIKEGYIKQIEDFVIAAARNYDMRDFLRKFASENGARGVKKMVVTNAQGKTSQLSIDNILLDSGMESYKMPYKRYGDKYKIGFVQQVMQGDKTRVLDIDEVYPLLSQIKKYLEKKERQSLQDFMEVLQVDGKKTYKSVTELYHWLLAREGLRYEEGGHIILSLPDDSINAVLKENGDIINLKQSLRNSEWERMEPGDYRDEDRCRRFVEEVLEKKVVGKSNSDYGERIVYLIKKTFLKRLIDNYPRLQVSYVSLVDFRDLADDHVMFEESLRQIHNVMINHILLDPYKLFTEIEKINSIRGEYEMPLITMEDIVGKEQFDKLIAQINSARDIVRNTPASELAAGIDENSAEELVIKYFWLQENHDKSEIFDRLARIDFGKDVILEEYHAEEREEQYPNPNPVGAHVDVETRGLEREA